MSNSYYAMHNGNIVIEIATSDPAGLVSLSCAGSKLADPVGMVMPGYYTMSTTVLQVSHRLQRTTRDIFMYLTVPIRDLLSVIKRYAV